MYVRVCDEVSYSFVGRKEGTVSAGSSYFVFTIGHDGTFEASPVDNW